MRERWGSGKAAVQAIKDVALSQRKCAVVPKKGGTYRLLQCDSASTAVRGMFALHDTGTKWDFEIGM